MILLTPLALIALVLLPLLVLLHLRRRRYQPAEVASLLIWHEVVGEPMSSGNRRTIPAPWLLLLQLLAVAALVFALARPESAAAPRRQWIFVLDDSYRMAATDTPPSRLAVARQAIDRQIAGAAGATLFTVIVATAQPYVLISSDDRAQVQRALATVTPTTAPADLVAALRLAAGSGVDPAGRDTSVLVAYAREETLPRVVGAPASFAAIPVGLSSQNQAMVGVSARCSSGVHPTCAAYAAVRNEDDRFVTVPLVVEGDGTVLAERSLDLPANSVTGVSFPIPAGTHVLSVYLARQDILPLDNAAWCVVPGADAVPEPVTLVGDASRVAPVRQALAALPNVVVRVLPPARYGTAPRPANGMLILDGWLPGGALPSVPGLLLIDPPRLPGGSISGSLSDTTISGQDPSSSLLTGVDLTSLDIAPGAAPQVRLPAGLSPVVWSASGPLLAAGVANGQRLAVLSFDPGRSNLPQLSAFPVLLQNILQWTASWLPSSLTLGQSLTLAAPPGTTAIRVVGAGLAGSPIVRQTLQPSAAQAPTYVAPLPGLYTISERGSWGTRSGAVAVNLEDTTADLATPSGSIVWGASPSIGQGSASTPARASWWPWIGVVALLLIVAEWLYVAIRREGA